MHQPYPPFTSHPHHPHAQPHTHTNTHTTTLPHAVTTHLTAGVTNTLAPLPDANRHAPAITPAIGKWDTTKLRLTTM